MSKQAYLSSSYFFFSKQMNFVKRNPLWILSSNILQYLALLNNLGLLNWHYLSFPHKIFRCRAVCWMCCKTHQVLKSRMWRTSSRECDEKKNEKKEEKKTAKMCNKLSTAIKPHKQRPSTKGQRVLHKTIQMKQIRRKVLRCTWRKVEVSRLCVDFEVENCEVVKI